MNQRLTRRNLLKLGLGAAAGAAGANLLIGSRGALSPVASAQPTAITPRYFLAGTDGWISLPGQGSDQFHPDALAPQGKTTYVFGFADVTSMLSAGIPSITASFKNRAQICAPLMYFDEGGQYVIRLTNLGLQQRPDLTDAHTVHWHGFRNALPMFDGEPSSSIAVPMGRTFDYAYRPRDAGTYMYHCHFEDTEHVHMGMTGPVFVRPLQNGTSKTYAGRPYTKFAYNDGDGSTGYDREYVIFLSEVWNESHWDDAHIQLPDWTDYKADFFLMNGRVYPDTLLANGAVAGRSDLDTQPYSSLVRCNAGERVLLRFINLGFTKAAMTLSGTRLSVVGMDAVLLRGRTGADGSYSTNTIPIGPGESVDAIFQAPTYAPSASGYNTYPLYNRSMGGASNNGLGGLGGQLTEVRVFNGTQPAQAGPNDLL